MRSAGDHPPFLFFIGSGRSGTTLIREIFNAHPDCAIPDETHFVPMLAKHRWLYEPAEGGFRVDRLLRDLNSYEQFRRMLPAEEAKKALGQEPRPTDYPNAIRRLYATYAAREGKTRYGDKTPRYCLDVPTLAMVFPEARFVHVIRDGRDVALSVKQVSFGPDDLAGAAQYWRNRALATRRFGEVMDPWRYTEYRHEDLLENTEDVVRQLCEFADLKFEPEMLKYHERMTPRTEAHHPHVHRPPTKGLRDWRSELSLEQVRLIELLVGDALDELGYDLATDEFTLDRDTERNLRVEAKKMRRVHVEWEASSFGIVNVPARRPPSVRRRYRLGWPLREDTVEIEQLETDEDADPLGVLD
jgi:hypothetical protein